MFSVMLNVAMREEEEEEEEGAIWDNNMHKEQCIGPGHWASPWWFPVCFSGSVYQTDPLLQAVCDEGERGSKPEWVTPSCGETVFLCVSAMRSGADSEDQAWTGGDASVHWQKVRVFFFFLKSGLLCAV